jgi:hypothetical protein
MRKFFCLMLLVFTSMLALNAKVIRALTSTPSLPSVGNGSPWIDVKVAGATGNGATDDNGGAYHTVLGQ